MPNHSVSIISYLSYDYGQSSLKQFLTESQIGCKHTWTETRIMTSFHHIQRVPPPCCGRTFCTQCSWSNRGREKFRAPSLSTGIRVEKKKKQSLYSSLNWTCHLHVVSINESNLKRLEKRKLGFLKGENLSVLLYLFSRFLNYLMSTYRIISHL